MSVVLGKLGPPLKEGHVHLRNGKFAEEKQFSERRAFVVENDDYDWRTDEDYFAAERVKKRKKLLSIR